MTIEHIRFAPDVLRRLGEELVPHPEQGLVELVRNSYDADALNCVVELMTDASGLATIRVTDDGDGMTPEALRDGFLIVGRSRKSPRAFTRLGRRPVGDKGLGRLAALRLGRHVVLRTRPRQEVGAEYQLVLDWKEFDESTVVEAVPIPIEGRPTNRDPGTEIEINDIGVRFGRVAVRRLARSLLLLADPFAGDSLNAFRPRMISPEFEDLAKRVEHSYLPDADYHLTARVEPGGRGLAEVFDARGSRLFSTDPAGLSDDPYDTTAASFDMWSFLLGPGSFAARQNLTGEIRDWLDVVGGVHIYYRGLRVYPYGEQGHDWLDMNLRRVRSPEERPSTNNTIGRVVTADAGEMLLQKTDRSGFVENDTFAELRRFCMDALDWMADQRMRVAEQRRRDERQRIREERERAERSVAEVVQTLPPASRPRFSQAYDRLERVRKREVEVLRQDIQLYRTLGTVGTTIALFMHEAPRNLEQITEMTGTILARLHNILTTEQMDRVAKPARVITGSAAALRALTLIPRRLLDQRRRTFRAVDVHAVIADVLEFFEDLSRQTHVTIATKLTEDRPMVMATEAALDSILANLIGNAVTALTSVDAVTSERRIEIRTSTNDRYVFISVLDNGPGIEKLGLDVIWLPGKTTTTGGTGLGLTIVRDTVMDLKGEARGIAHGELGGAEFIIELPKVRGE